MDAATFWWVAAVGLVIAELLTGTVYLLMIATGAVAGALAAHLGMNSSMQIGIAAVISTAATLIWHLKKSKERKSKTTDAHANPNVNQDIGAKVQVDAWNADGTAQVQYRGAQWTVLAAHGAAQIIGPHRVKEVVGNRLVVEPV